MADPHMPEPVRIKIGLRTIARIGISDRLIVLKAKCAGDDACLGMNTAEAREIARALDAMADAVDAARQTPDTPKEKEQL